MSKRIIDIPEVNSDTSSWASLLEETNAEIRSSPELTDDEKRMLDDLDNLPEKEWTLGVCSGKPIFETIIEDRGER